MRYIGNSVQVFFKDGKSIDGIAVDSVSPKLAANQWDELNAPYTDQQKLAATVVDDFMALLVV